MPSLLQAARHAVAEEDLLVTVMVHVPDVEVASILLMRVQLKTPFVIAVKEEVIFERSASVKMFTLFINRQDIRLMNRKMGSKLTH